jgi:hypothetical protein
MWFPTQHYPYDRDMRIKSHLEAGGVMTPGRIHDPEGAKTVLISFKSATGAILAAKRQTYIIICFSDTVNGRLKVGIEATARH